MITLDDFKQQNKMLLEAEAKVAEGSTDSCHHPLPSSPK